MPSPPPSQTGRATRKGLVELLLVTGFLAVAAAGAVALFGDELRQALGAAPASQPARRLP